MTGFTKSLITALIPAIIAFTCVAAPCQKSTAQLLQQARQLQGQGKLDEALELYRKCLDIDSTDTEVLFASGELYLQKLDYSNAVKTFSNLLVLDPENAWANLYMGQASLKLGQTAKAKAAFGRVLSAKPTSVRALVGMGEAELQAGHSFTANDYFKRALALDPKNKELADNVARLRSDNLGRLKASEEEPRQTERKPTDQTTGETGTSGSAPPVAGVPAGGQMDDSGRRQGERAWPWFRPPEVPTTTKPFRSTH